MRRNKIHYAWAIMICCFLLQAATTGIFNNCVSLYNPLILKEFGFSNGAFSATMTIRSFVSSASLILVSRVFNKKTYKLIYVICAAMCSLIFVSQIFYTKLWQWYVENALLGFFLGFILTVPLNMMIQNWFKDSSGLALGFAMAASGLCGVVVNPLSSFMISNYGWRSGIIMLGVLCFVLIVPTILFFAKWTPEEKGMEPYVSSDKDKEDTEKEKLSDDKGLILMTIIEITIIYCITQYTYSISVFIDSLGYDVSFAALVTSAIMLGNLIGKVLLGGLVDRYGSFKVTNITTVLIALSFIFFAFFKMKILLAAGGLFYGMSMSLASLLPGVLAKECFYPDIRGAVMSKTTSIATLAAALFYLGVSYSYDLFGSFRISFLLALLLCVITIVLSKKIERQM
ncbi:MAG: MFS transporter [Erysipelotrichaceae bacterium]|nr:MFS transporter [Erysipelotrichaceae bacterium]